MYLCTSLCHKDPILLTHVHLRLLTLHVALGVGLDLVPSLSDDRLRGIEEFLPQPTESQKNGLEDDNDGQRMLSTEHVRKGVERIPEQPVLPLRLSLPPHLLQPY